ncbi:MAG: hypothetical protein ACR2O6_03405, partial [Ilumatobacteraceae bacterium]
MGRRDDADLPIRFHPLSNGEYAPLPRSPLIAETVRRTLDTADANARRLGIDRRTFLRRATGMATVLATLVACSREEGAADTTARTGTTGSSTTSTTSTTEPGTGGT